MSTNVRRGAIILALLLVASVARAQDARIDAQLTEPTRSQVQAIVVSARVAGLPTEPLVDKALEGARKRADGVRIARAVRALAARLQTSRSSLGTGASESDLVAGAAALQSGATAEVLHQLRSARPSGALSVPLVVLSDLVARGVPTDTAAAVVLLVAREGMGDDAFLTLQRDVQRDVMGGAVPSSAAAVRTRGVLAGGTVRRPTRSVSADAFGKGGTTASTPGHP
jgi:hypothetical protein